MANILIVEDDVTIAELLEVALETDGHRITASVSTVAEAMRAIQQQQPDFAVIDVDLGAGGDGTDVGRFLRETTSTGVLFSTGNDVLAEITGCVGDAVMTKPYRMRDVNRALGIIAAIVKHGRTSLPLPRNFRLLNPQLADIAAPL